MFRKYIWTSTLRTEMLHLHASTSIQQMDFNMLTCITPAFREFIGHGEIPILANGKRMDSVEMARSAM
jgi:hypothetical protein